MLTYRQWIMLQMALLAAQQAKDVGWSPEDGPPPFAEDWDALAGVVGDLPHEPKPRPLRTFDFELTVRCSVRVRAESLEAAVKKLTDRAPSVAVDDRYVAVSFVQVPARKDAICTAANGQSLTDVVCYRCAAPIVCVGGVWHDSSAARPEICPCDGLGYPHAPSKPAVAHA